MSRVAIPGGRAVPATLDEPGAGTDACVVACPPHPEMGGSRSDRRLRTVTDGLVDRGIACLRFDYGPWDDGRGERRDAGNALDWVRERYDRVGLFGYSFGAAAAILVAAERSDLGALAVLAPPAGFPDGSDVAGALDEIEVATLVVYGDRDDTIDWRPVVDRAEAAGHDVESVPADHHFVGQDRRIRDAVAPFFESHLS